MVEIGLAVIFSAVVAAGLIGFGFLMGRTSLRTPEPPPPKQYNPGQPALADADPFAMAMEPDTNGEEDK